MPPTIATRRTICEDTLLRSLSITSATPEATLDSTFIPAQLPLLSSSSSCPNLTLAHPISVLNSDTFAAARTLLSSSPALRGKVAVLNLASDIEPAGGWRYTLSLTQEEALCYSSTLYATLRPEYYPWPNTGAGCIAGVYSPAVVVFKDTLDNDCRDLAVSDRITVGVITVAAPCLPTLTQDKRSFADEGVLEELREKIRLVLRMAAGDGKTALVLGAMGCGAYRCPPGLVATEMKDVLEEGEWEGWFERIVFAVYGGGVVGARNLECFRKEFQGKEEEETRGLGDEAGDQI